MLIIDAYPISPTDLFRAKKSIQTLVWMLRKKRLATTCSPTVLTAVPSALEVLTTEFGMGSGVAPPLGSPAGK